MSDPDHLRPQAATALPTALEACLAAPGWVRRVLRHGPFGSGGDLIAAAEQAFPLSDDELDAALADHPAIGARHTGTGRSARFSNAEQGDVAALSARDTGAVRQVQEPTCASTPALEAATPESHVDENDRLEQRLAELNGAYEERFGHVFLIRAAGRTRSEIIAELERRIELTAQQERLNTAEQLQQITLLRVHQIAKELFA